MTLSPEEQQQLIANYIEKAKKTEQNIPVLIEHQQFFAAVNRIYYGIFYMLSALAIKHHFSTSKHTQLIDIDAASPIMKRSEAATRASQGARAFEGIGLFFFTMASDSWST